MASIKDKVKIDPKDMKKKGLGFVGEFKEFIAKGNVLDLAVGVVIGGAFSKIVTSLVNDILMPIIGVIIGGIDFSHLSVNFKDAVISYGSFLNNVIDFLIVAFCIFMVVKLFNRITRKKEAEEKKEEANEEKKEEEINKRQEELLEEILKELKKKK